MAGKAWQLGDPGTLPYRFYDALRRRLNSRLVDYLCSKAITKERCRVLEAGSGPAFASSLLATHCNICLSVAVDFDLEALLEARRRDPDLALVVADLRNLPFRDESLDLVWNSSTIEHLDDPASALVEMQRVTQQGGKVFVGVPNLYGPLGFQHWIRETSVGVWIGETFNLSELSTMAARAGLQPQDSIFYFFRFFVGVLAQK
jgi:ubiquinone/menaquinone biosynthesis C-methylase UbiE